MIKRLLKLLLLPLLLMGTGNLLFAEYADSLYFTFQIGGVAPSLQTLTFPSQPGREATGITVQSTQPWILVALSSTSTPTVVTIAVNANGMAAGIYGGTVEVKNPSSSWTYLVSLTVTPAAPTVNASSGNLLFNAVQGGLVPAMQAFQLTSSVANTAIFSELNYQVG